MKRIAIASFVFGAVLVGFSVGSVATANDGGISPAQRHCERTQEDDAARCDVLYRNDVAGWNECQREAMDDYYLCMANRPRPGGTK